MAFDKLAQPKWATYWGGTADEWGYGIAVGTSDNLYITGTSTSASLPTIQNNGTYIQSTGLGNNYYYGFVTEFQASNGRDLWETFFGGTSQVKGYKVAIDKNNNVFVVGRVDYTTLFGVATGGVPPTNGGFPILNPGGSAYYQTSIAGTQIGHSGNDLNMDGFIAEFNSSNKLLWSTLYGGNDYDDILDVKVNPTDQSIAIVGRTVTQTPSNNYCGVPTNGGFPLCNTGSPYFQNTTNMGIGTGNGYISVFSNSGVLNWSTYFDGEPSGLAFNSKGDLYVSGITPNPTSSNSCSAPTNNGYPICNSIGGTTPQTWKGSYDAYIAEFNTSHDLIYSSYYGGTTDEEVVDPWNELGNTKLAVDLSDNVYMTGATEVVTGSSNDFPTVAHSSFYNLAQNQPQANIPSPFIVAFNSSDQLLWATLYGGTGTGTNGDGYDDGLSIAASGDSKLYVVGNTCTLNFPYTYPSTGSPYHQPAATSSATESIDAFIGRFNISSLSNGISEFSEKLNDFNIYPNPADDKINIEFKATMKGDITISLHNVLGQVIYSEQLQNYTGNYKKSINVDNLKTGIYLISINFANGNLSKKFIKQ